MTDETTWPREIWAAELREHEQIGQHVFSEHATTARFEGDTEREREFHRYVDGDIFDSQERYFKAMIDQERARANALVAALRSIEEGLPAGSTLINGRDPLWRDAYRELQRMARRALRRIVGDV